MSDLKIQGEVQISAEGAEQALDHVGDKASQMARRLQVEGEKAGKAVDGIGDGADRSAEKFTRAEGRMSESIKRATKSLQELGKTASQKLELRISERGLDPAKFEPMLAKLRELEAAQGRVAASAPKMGSGLQNASYQLQDFVVQVNGGVDATRALAMQLPQMLVGFGAAGAAIGVVAALLPNLVSAFGDSAAGAKTFADAMSDYDKAIGKVGETTRQFDMDGLAEQFNKSSDAVRGAIIEQVRFQQEYLRTTSLMAGKKFGDSLGGLGEYSTLNKMAGAFGSSPAEELAGQLGLSLSAAQDILPILNGLKKGTEDVGLAFEKVGVSLLGGNQKAVELATSLSTLAKNEKDAAAAASVLADTQAKMAKGHVATKKEAEAAAKARKAEIDEFVVLMAKLNAQGNGVEPQFLKDVQTLVDAYGAGKIKADAYAVALEQLAGNTKLVRDQQQDAARAQKEWVDAANKAAEAARTQIEGLEDKARAAERELENYGLTKAEIEGTIIARLEERKSIYDGLDGYEDQIAAIEREIAARKRLQQAAKGIESKDLAKKAAEDAGRAWQKFSDDIERSLTDALMRGFEAGNDFGENFVKTLENTIKTAALKMAVQVILNPVTGQGGILQQGAEALGLAGQGGSSGNSSTFGSTLSNVSSIAGLFGANTIAGTAGSGLYGAFATSAIGQSIGLSSVVPGLMGPTTSGLALGSATGGATLSGLGAALPYIGGAIAVVSLLSGLFKNKVAAPEMSLLNGANDNYYRGDPNLAPYVQDSPFGQLVVTGQHLSRNGLSIGAINQNTADLARADSVFASSLSSDELGRINRPYYDGGIWGFASREQGSSDFSGAISLRLDQITDIVGGWANDLFDTFSGSVNDSYAMATAIFGARGNEFAESLATELLDLGQGNAFQQSGEQLATTFVRLVGSIGAVNEVMEKLDLTLFDASLAGADAANTLVEAFGSLDTFKAAASDYYSQFYDQSDQLDILTAQLGEQFAALNKTMPETHDGFKALVTAAREANDADLFASLLAIAPVFDLWADASEAAVAAAEQAAAQLAASRQGWQDKLDVLTGATTDRQLALQRDLASTTDAATQALIRQVYAQEEMLAAAEAAAQAAAQAAAAEAERAAQYTATARGLQIELATAQGNTAAATAMQRADELQALRELDPTGMLARIKEQIYGALDAEALHQEQQRAAEEQARLAQQAAEASRRAAEEQARAAEQVRQAWQRAADGILDTMRSLRDDLMGTGAQGFAAAQANFAIATAAARAGDQNATNRLPELARAVADLSANVSGSRLEQDLITARTLASLSGTLESLKKFGIEVPAFASGGLHHGGLRLVGERGPELEATGPARIYNFDQMRGLLQGGDIAAELRELRRENARLREIVETKLGAIETNTGNTHGALTGAPLLVEVA